MLNCPPSPTKKILYESLDTRYVGSWVVWIVGLSSYDVTPMNAVHCGSSLSKLGTCMQADKLTYTNWTLYTYMTLHTAWSSMSCTQQDRWLFTGTAESAVTEHDDRLKITLYKNVKSESSRSRGTDPAHHMLSRSGSCSCTDRWKHLPHRSMNRSMPTLL